MAFVLDASVTAAMAAMEERSEYVEQVEWRLIRESAVVPPIWWYEVRNFLVVSERRKRLKLEDSSEFLAILATYPIEIDPQVQQDRALLSARSHGLSVYDAAYLELAQRRRLPLATLDRALEAAARAEGIQLLD
ncbi:MAG TPA: type II toxin-antitoxin system VapC family toxin [Terracidiphilus sp.]